MFSKKITQQGLFSAILITGIFFFIIKYGFLYSDGWFISDLPETTRMWILTNARTIEAVTGAVLPFIVLGATEFFLKTESPHFIVINQFEEKAEENEIESSLFPAGVMAVTFAVLSVIIAFLALTEENESGAQWVLSISLLAIALIIWYLIKRMEKQRHVKKLNSINTKI